MVGPDNLGDISIREGGIDGRKDKGPLRRRMSHIPGTIVGDGEGSGRKEREDGS